MADVKNVEAAVGERDLLAGLPPFFHAPLELITSEDFLVHEDAPQCARTAGGYFSIASSNSFCDTVAVPLFMTTMPPA